MTTVEAIKKAVAARCEDLTDLVCALVSIPSENTPPMGNERAAQEYLYEHARRAGLDAVLYEMREVPGLHEHPCFRPGREYDGRPNLIVTYPGSGSGRSLLLTGHIDSVPAVDTGWTHPPFGGECADGRIYGRGAYDMKAGLVCGLMALEILREVGVKLTGRLGLESVIDEEFAGVNGTIAGRVRGDAYEAAVVLEPSDLNIYHAHRGLRVAEVKIGGCAGVPWGGVRLDNPADRIGSIIDWFNRFGRDRNKRMAGRTGYEDYEVPVPYMTTRVAAGEGGRNKVLAVPAQAAVEFFWETLPGETKDEIDRAFHAGLDEWAACQPGLDRAAVKISFPYEWLPASAVPPDHPLVQKLHTAVYAVTGKPPRVRGGSFPCDAYVFNLYAKTPAIIFGPRGGNAHAADEFVIIDDLAVVVESICLLALDWCGVAD